jgi:hypothetical protein
MQTIRLSLSFAFSLLFVASTVQAQQSPAPVVPTRDTQAVAVLQATIKALGGSAPSDSTATGTVTETVGSESQDGTIQVLTRGTGESLEAITLPDLSQTTVYSYSLAGQTTGSAPQEALSGELTATSQTALYPLPLFMEVMNDPDSSLQYVGQETVNGAVTNHIRMWDTFASRPSMRGLSSFSTRDVWMHQAAFLRRSPSRNKLRAERRSRRW